MSESDSKEWWFKIAGATYRAIATISYGSTTIVNHEVRKTLYAAHGYPEGIREVFRWVSMGYPWVSRVSPPGGWPAATIAVKLRQYEEA